MGAPRFNVLIAVPSLGRIHPHTIRSISALTALPLSDVVAHVRYLICAPLTVARHRLVHEFLANPTWTHLLFVDSDMGLPADTLTRLLGMNVPIACLPCPILAPGLPGTSQGPAVTTNVWISAPEVDDTGHKIVRFLDPDEFPNKPFSCYGTGLACCLIRRDVFEHIPLPWFAFSYRNDYAGLVVGEDAHFFNRCRDAGLPFLIDPARHCAHYKEIDLTHFENFFLDHAVEWGWPVTPAPGKHSLFLASVCGDHDCHAATATFLEVQRLRGCPSGVFAATDYQGALRAALTDFLDRRGEDLLFLMDDRTVPPDNFLERIPATLDAFGTGLFRELTPRGPAWGCQILVDGRQCTLTAPPDEEEAPLLANASLRATVISRNTLAALGSAWTENATNPRAAGEALALAIHRLSGKRPALYPIDCQHFDTIDIGMLLQAKMRLKAQLRGSTLAE